jgi:hypothetical protein
MSLVTAFARTTLALAAIVVLIGIGTIIGGLYVGNQLQMPFLRQTEDAGLRVGVSPGDPRGRTMIGGDISCGTWTQARQQDRQKPVTYQWWVAGFLSGLHYEDESNPSHDPVAGNDVGGIAAWIDNYCRENPLKTIAYASIQLMKLLRSGR